MYPTLVPRQDGVKDCGVFSMLYRTQSKCSPISGRRLLAKIFANNISALPLYPSPFPSHR